MAKNKDKTKKEKVVIVKKEAAINKAKDVKIADKSVNKKAEDMKSIKTESTKSSKIEDTKSIKEIKDSQKKSKNSVNTVISKLKALFASRKIVEEKKTLSNLDKKLIAKLEAKNMPKLAQKIKNSEKQLNKNGLKLPFYQTKTFQWSSVGGVTVAFVGVSIYVILTLGAQPLDGVGLLSQLKDLPETPSIAFETTKKTTSGYVAANSGFEFEIESMPQGDFAKQIEIYPEIEFEISEDVEDGTISIIPKGDLDQDVTYEVTMLAGTKFADGSQLSKDLSWIFKVEPDFAVVGITPRDGGRNIPVNSVIEFEFNHKDILEGELEKYVSITPAIDGRFEKYGLKIVFVPEADLNEYTQYTVVVDKGFTTESGESLFEDTEVVFETSYSSGERAQYIYIAGMGDIDSSNGGFRFTVGGSSNNPNDLKYSLYSINTDIAVETLLDDTYHDELPTGVKLISTNSISLQESETVVPEKNGFYVAKIFAGNDDNNVKPIYRYFIKSDLSVYASLNSDVVAGYVYNMSTNKVVSGVDIDLYKDGEKIGSVKSQSDGFFRAEKNADAILIQSGDNNVFLNAYAVGDFDYWIQSESDVDAEMRLDKPVYRAGDIVKLNGVVRSSNVGDIFIDSAVDTVKITASMNSYGEQDRLVAPLYESEVVVSGKYGVFSTEFIIPENVSGYMSISAQVNDVWVDNLYTQITDYSVLKETYSISFNKDFYEKDEKGTMTIIGEDYAGRPLSGKSLSGNLYYGGENSDFFVEQDGAIQIENIFSYGISGTLWDKDIKLNKDGIYTEVVDFSRYYEKMGLPPVHVLSVDLSSTDGALYLNTDRSNIFVASASYDVQIDVNLDTDVVSSSARVGDNAEFTISAYELWDTEKVGNQELRVTANRRWYERIKDGNYYDPVTKTTFPQYKTIVHDEAIWTDRVVKLNDNGDVKISMDDLQEGSYSFIVYYTAENDGEGMTVHKEINNLLYVNKLSQYNLSHSLLYIDTPYRLEVGDTAETSVIGTGTGRGLYIVSGYDVVERGTFEITDINKPATINYDITDEYYPAGSICVVMPYTLEGENSVLGRRWASKCSHFSVKSDTGLLNVEIETSKDKYNPDEEVSVAIKVTDTEGNPVKANFSLRVVNKALLDMYSNQYGDDIDVELRNSIYTSLRSRLSFYYSSIHRLDGWGGMGAGGGDEGGALGRADFTDSLYWDAEVETNESGVAVVKFPAGDSLTTWLVDGWAMDSKDRFGGESLEFKTTLSRSVDLELPAWLVDGDTFDAKVNVDNFEEAFTGKVEVTCIGCEQGTQTFDLNLSQNERITKSFEIVPGDNADEITITAKLFLGGIEKPIDVITRKMPVVKAGVESTNSVVDILNADETEVIQHVVLSDNVEKSTTKISVNVGKRLEYSNLLYPMNDTSTITRELAASINVNSLLYQNYEELSLGISKDALLARITVAYSILRDNQAINGGFGDLSYDAVNIFASAEAASAFNSLEEVGIEVPMLIKGELSKYFVEVINSGKSSPQDRVLALNGLSYIDTELTLIYIPVIVESMDVELESEEEAMEGTLLRKSPLAIAMLMQAYNNIGSTGDAAYWAIPLKSFAETTEMTMFWVDQESNYDRYSSSAYVTAQVYKALGPIEEWEVKYKVRNWLLNSYELYDVGTFEYGPTLYALLSADAEDFQGNDNPVSFVVYINDEKVGEYKIENVGVRNSLEIIIDSKHYIVGANEVKIVAESEVDLYISTRVSEINEDKDDFTDNFKITRKFTDLTTGKAVDKSKVSVFHPVRVTISVTPKNDVKQVEINDYIASGFEPLRFDVNGVSQEMRNLFWNWNNHWDGTNRWGDVESQSVTFWEYEMKKDKTYKYEYVMMPSFVGTGYAGGVLVVPDMDPDGASYLDGGEVVVR